MKANILDVSEESDSKSFCIIIKFDYEIFVRNLGMEATASLVDAFYNSLVENLSATLKHKCPTEPFSLHKDPSTDAVKLSNSNQGFHDLTIELLRAINMNSQEIINQVIDNDLLIEEEQKHFFDRFISYEVIHALIEQQNKHKPVSQYNVDRKPKI
jgi:hypothetical protein